MQVYTGPRIMEETVKYCQEHGYRPMELDDIGKKKPAGEFITLEILKENAAKAIEGPQGAYYFENYSTKALLSDLVKSGHPEYAIDWMLRETDYIPRRRDDVYMKDMESLLGFAMIVVAYKYGDAGADKLSQRFRITPLIESLVDLYFVHYRNSQI